MENTTQSGIASDLKLGINVAWQDRKANTVGPCGTEVF